MDLDISTNKRILHIVCKNDAIVFFTDHKKNIFIAHSPHNLGDTRYRQKHKVLSLIGLGSSATCISLDIKK